ncbi:hypothetical protein, partial [Actinophytocola sp.]|uniref:hypothetical protein n=1 Tax=Actinophytocola sp. TaxID=1872138 RepID=UPI003D6AAA24
MKGRSRPEAAPGSGGPVGILQGLPDCSCPKARAWDFLCQSTHVLDLLTELDEWLRLKTTSETSSQLSAAGNWRPGLTYAELRERRRLTSVHPCGRCGVQVELSHPL